MCRRFGFQSIHEKDNVTDKTISEQLSVDYSSENEVCFDCWTAKKYDSDCYLDILNGL